MKSFSCGLCSNTSLNCKICHRDMTLVLSLSPHPTIIPTEKPFGGVIANLVCFLVPPLFHGGIRHIVAPVLSVSLSVFSSVCVFTSERPTYYDRRHQLLLVVVIFFVLSLDRGVDLIQFVRTSFHYLFGSLLLPCRTGSSIVLLNIVDA